MVEKDPPFPYKIDQEHLFGCFVANEPEKGPILTDEELAGLIKLGLTRKKEDPRWAQEVIRGVIESSDLMDRLTDSWSSGVEATPPSRRRRRNG